MGGLKPAYLLSAVLALVSVAAAGFGSALVSVP